MNASAAVILQTQFFKEIEKTQPHEIDLLYMQQLSRTRIEAVGKFRER